MSADSDLAEKAKQFAGTYRIGDDFITLSVDLKADGSYRSDWRGCLGTFGTANGKWKVFGDHILLMPRGETGCLQKYLRSLDIVQKGKLFYVVRSKDRKAFDEDGPKEGNHFVKLEDVSLNFKYP